MFFTKKKHKLPHIQTFLFLFLLIPITREIGKIKEENKKGRKKYKFNRTVRSCTALSTTAARFEIRIH